MDILGVVTFFLFFILTMTMVFLLEDDYDPETNYYHRF